MAKLKVKYQYVEGEFEERFNAKYEVVAKAATAAARETAEVLKHRARSNIARAGFGPRWQNSLRVVAYPKHKESASPAVFLYHKIPYSDVFESGATIRGNDYIWLPLSTTPKRGNKKATPKTYSSAGIKLVSIANARKPLMGAKVALSPKNMREPRPNLTFSQIQSGAFASNKGQPSRTLPLFVGVSQVTMRKRFNIKKLTQDEATRIPGRYRAHFSDSGN